MPHAVEPPAPLESQALGTADPLGRLNERQRDAVEHGLDAPGLRGPALLVLAGAGTGKTLTLASRVARLVTAGADPQRILLLTFSRRAAREMEHRAGQVLRELLQAATGSAPPSLPWAGTFHSVGARLLREYAERIGLSPDYGVLDRGDAEELLGMVRSELGLDRTQLRNRFPLKGTCLAIYSRAVNSGAALSQVLLDAYPWCAAHEADLRRLFAAYVAEKQRQAVLDFDDLLLYWHEMLGDGTLARHVAGRFDHVLVDEYQDTNAVQARILRRLSADGRGLTVVGDDAQSIYSFRAAEVRNMLEFPAQFDPPARVVALERNYRSTRPILDASNAVIALWQERLPKTLWSDRTSPARPELVDVPDEAAQARWVADRVLAHREGGLRLRSQAVLFRSSPHSALLELELARRNIPFVKYGGLQFLEAAHVKDMLAVLRWADNLRHRLAGLRVAQLLPGFGAATARRLMDAIDTAADPMAALTQFAAPAAAREDWSALVALVSQLRTAAQWPDDIERVRRWYAPHLERLHDDARVRQADLVQLARMAQGHASRVDFVTDLTLDPPAATSDQAGAGRLDEDYLVLSTIHSAKGLEWQAVFVLHAVDGCIPSDMSCATAQVEEERRLLYVALTRARHHLHVLVPQRFYVTHQAARGDRHVYASLTRFIPSGAAALFERVAPLSIDGSEPDSKPDVVAAPIDVASRLRNAWG
jgi:DNA helicase-2/ATP-dependent DNA helicase PcrA